MSSSGTIAAIASPAGPARRGLIRLSGPDTRAILEASVSVAVPPERAALRGRFDDGTGEQPLLLFWMPGPTSYTREDVAELHLPGNPRLLDRALERVLALGARPALHGEFSRRAFLGGRIDLTRAEGILELVAASNESERRAATGLLAGGLERRILDLREALDDARALVEASLDFDSSETGHVPEEELGRRLDEIGERLREALRWEVRRQAPSALPRALLHGAPNAGKSSLFNALVGGGAIVSDLEGTTRDTLSGLWSLPGGACLLLDAPGLDRLAGGADREAQRLAAALRESVDLVLWVVDRGRAAGPGLEEERGSLPTGRPRLLVRSKADLGPVADGRGPERGGAQEGSLSVSAVTGEGLEELRREVADRLGLAGTRAVAESGSRELFARHRGALEEAVERAAGARTGLLEGEPLDLVAEALRAATDALDGITGTTSSEDLLDRIFTRFCLGK